MPNTESNLPTAERQLPAFERRHPAERLLDVAAGVDVARAVAARKRGSSCSAEKTISGAAAAL